MGRRNMVERVRSFSVEFWDCEKCLSQNEIEQSKQSYLDLGVYVSRVKCSECGVKTDVEYQLSQ